MPREQEALVGRKAIANFLGWSLAKTMKELPNLKEAGVVKRMKVGRGHTRGIRLVALPSLLERYWIEYIENS